MNTMRSREIVEDSHSEVVIPRRARSPSAALSYSAFAIACRKVSRTSGPDSSTTTTGWPGLGADAPATNVPEYLKPPAIVIVVAILPRPPLHLRLPELVVVHALRDVGPAPVEGAVVEGHVPFALLEASPDLAPESCHEALDVRPGGLKLVLADLVVVHSLRSRDGRP